MDTIDEAFASGILNKNDGSERVLSEPIRHALGIGKRTLNKYYSLTDDSDLYRIAMVLNPTYKLEYFRGPKWSQEWIDAALYVTCAAWEKDFKPSASAKSPCLWRLQGHLPNPEQPQSNKSALESLGISGHL
ncbi:hypothetical protein C8R42DRAFT_735539 [Lentinula raphanica]|nr:hypothetical protein C8R42DRAFT_735539 [Lentinula raphanica]